MTFIDAVLKITVSKTLELCPNDDERSGKHDICVHRKSGEYVGKLRWPSGKNLAYVDDQVIWVLEEENHVQELS
jgi:hypothetical protein